MANSIITTAGLALFADAAATGKTIAIDKMIFADVPGLDVSQTPDPAQGLPAGIVCRTEIDRSAKIDDRTVVYSKTLAATVGDFYINWIGLYSTSESTLVAVCYVPRHKKYATSEFEAGNTLYKNFALSFANAAALTGITIAPEAWQMQGEYALKEHTHTIPQVTGLQAALDGKENAGAVAEHNASGVAHWELFRGKISKPETGSAGQYLKLNPDGTCSWSDIDCVPVGTIFPFASAQPPAGAYLLNGQTIANCQTLYPQFWTWLSAEAAAGRVRTVADNAAFESELTAKGNCGAFVLNAGGTAGAVRLPSVTAGFIMGGTASQTGTTEAAGLPNITGAFGGDKLTDYATGWGTGAFTAETFNDTSAGGGSSGKNTRYAFSAANSNSIYGASSTVQPPAVRFAYCIKVYNATSALSEQDAAQLASLMQLKADTGLSNLTEDGEAKIKGVFTPPTSTDLNTVDAFIGFARFPSGMIMQWGESLIQNKETTFDIVFPVTFPNRCFTVVVGTKIGGNVAADSYGATDKLIQMVKATTSGATFFQQGFESNSNWIKGCWIAIGN